MTEQIENASALIEQYMASLPKDVASVWLGKLKTEAAVQEAKRYTSEIVVKVQAILGNVGGAMLDAIPPGRTLTIMHRAGLPAKDGQPATDPELVFNIEVSSSSTQNGRAPREGGKLIRVMLDGKAIEGTTWTGALHKVNEVLDAKDRCKIPDGAYSANRELNAFAKRLNKAHGKDRLIVVGEVEPAPEAPAPAPAPEATPEATPEAPKS